MARVHVRCWQETYRGLMPDAVLDDPDFPAARERMWTDVLTSERYRPNRVAVAERDGELAGIAMSGPPDDATAAWARQLYVLYVYAADHGTGTGEALLEAVVDSAEPAALWVADTNPRAQAFYRKHGFAADGTARFEDGVRRSAWSAACSTTGPAAPATGKPSVAAPAEETRLPGPLVWPLREWGQIKPASRLSDSGGADSSHHGGSNWRRPNQGTGR